MIRILIVEDSADKLREIVKEILKDSRLSENNIEFSNNSKDAKKKLASERFDLLILDMNLPKTMGTDALHLEGVEVLNFIKNNNRAIPPGYIVGLTAYAEELKDAESEFNSFVFKLIKFSHSNSSWKVQLSSAIKYLVDKDVPPYINDGSTYHTDVCIICALEEELEYVLNLYDNWKTVRVIGDNVIYRTNMIIINGVEVTIVAAAAPRMGMSNAAVLATKLISSFRPKIIVMTGICAGVRGKSNYGDILIADPIFDWGGGKWIADKTDGSLKFRPAPYPWRLDEDLLFDIKSMNENDNILKDIYEEFQGAKPDHKLKVYVDAMASGGSVLQSSCLMDDVKEQHKNLIGVEMESYAVFTAATYASNPKPKCISIKSVCDFGDEEKNDNFHTYASYTSAKYCSYLIQQLFSNTEDNNFDD
jgi:nucleoside phosphorylase/CheY-like chemotaxis protein